MASQITTKDSARLRLGELIVLADRLQHSMDLLRQEGHEILEAACEALDADTAETFSRSGGQATATCESVSRTRRELETAWLEVDHVVDELIGQAVDEISRFTTLAESRMRDYECRLRYDMGRAKLLAKDRSEQ